MTRDQMTVLWLGLIIISLNLIVHIGDFKKVIFSGPSSGSGSSNSAANSFGAGMASGFGLTPSGGSSAFAQGVAAGMGLSAQTPPNVQVGSNG